jgi:hypothetical protein
VQVEINKRDRDELFAAFESAGYRQTERHYTAAGKAELAKGIDPLEIAHNAIFEPSP